MTRKFCLQLCTAETITDKNFLSKNKKFVKCVIKKFFSRQT